MDGKGRFKDNIFIERLWRALKYDRIYLKAYETGAGLSKDLTAWFGCVSLPYGVMHDTWFHKEGAWPILAVQELLR